MGGGMYNNNLWTLDSGYTPITPNGMASMAFRQVNGVSPNGLMITSSQSDTGQPIMADYYVEIGAYSGEVRPFIHY